jgi:hypothetical protein
MRVLSILVRHMSAEEIQAASRELQHAADAEADATERQFLQEATDGLSKLAADEREASRRRAQDAAKSAG